MSEPLFDPLVWLILLPLAWATLALVLGPGRGAWPAIAGLTAQCWLAFDLAQKVGAYGTAGHAVGGWGAPLGIDLAVDGLSAAMLLLTQTVALPLAIYARSYFKAGDPAGAWFWPLTGFLIAGLNALFVSADLFNLYVTLELVGLAAVGLVAAGGGAQQVAAALRYLFATLVGSGAYLLGVALIYGVYGTVSIATLLPLVTDDAPRLVWIAGGLMVAGLMLKTALFPFHFWLPPAHGGAPAPVSALLSALVVKASFYLILRLWLGPLQAVLPAFAWLLATARRRGDLLGFLAGNSRRETETPDRLFDGGATRLPVPDLSLARGTRRAPGRRDAGIRPRSGQSRHVRRRRRADQGHRAGYGGRSGRRGRAPAGDHVRLRPCRHDADGAAAVLGLSRQVADYRGGAGTGPLDHRCGGAGRRPVGGSLCLARAAPGLPPDTGERDAHARTPHPGVERLRARGGQRACSACAASS